MTPEFTNDWFKNVRFNFEALLEKIPKRPKILEIGCYEGQFWNSLLTAASVEPQPGYRLFKSQMNHYILCAPRELR